jgi:hypothetical protein
MQWQSPIPSSFTTLQTDPPTQLAIGVRSGIDKHVVTEMVQAIRAVDWDTLVHAYGPATDVADQLIAAAVGDERTREAAWWNLWGNIHHQGTIYESTVPAAPIIARLAGWSSYPDRVEAICFLREIASADGVVVWRGDEDELVHDDERQKSLAADLNGDVRNRAIALLDNWRGEPPEVRRALLWLLGGLPELQERFSDLVEAELPPEYTDAWTLLQRGPDTALGSPA